ncbi:hypothetical protein [Chryseobacterium jejuense]|uniref:Uncharacterized protein n=1 Tax=Chryseobacterium jejuense TaxID=445960 RepID=A0A2X2VAH7_CHRJE|nr:hypothetical protein [Chryseobacterium jejuense]SDJ09033.1 hypothetical protein SAMN05421542_2604 [Chryseobacterium jejuense]SQB27842.1 Uncharacterised protein [Chryseobacterium jejuense]
MRIEILKLNGIFNMSFGKTFFTGESENINNFIHGKSKWDIFINDLYFNTIEFENENLPLTKSDIETKNRSFSYNGFFDKEQLDFKGQNIILKLKEI